MSWEERLSNIKFTIITGDKKRYNPLWINGNKGKEYNFTKYDFINVEKSYIDRKKAQSSKYNLVFYFQGEDNIEQSDAFELSANDNRPWEVKHPFYGNIIGQPVSIQRDDTSYNVTKITVEFWETISSDNPRGNVSERDIIIERINNINNLSVQNFASGALPTSADIPAIKENSINISSKFNLIQTAETLVSYNNTLSKSLRSVDRLIDSPGNAISSNQNLLILPSTYQNPVLKRIQALKFAYDEIKTIITGRNSKYYFESLAATAIASIAKASLNPIEGDFVTRSQVNTIADIVLLVYEDYLQSIDMAQVDQYDTQNTWYPDVVLQKEVYDLIVKVVGNLYQIAFSAKQERIIELEKDSNVFLLTHRFMGLSNDLNIESFRTINNIKGRELLKIKKGRKIKYFI